MEHLIDIFLHIDRYLGEIISQYQYWTYLILFLVIFCETGLVITPFLPGDSLLFAAGALTATTGALEINTLFIIISIAAVAGDTANYWIGKKIGPKVFNENIRFLKREYLERTHKFYEKHGGKTIIIARFVPIVRTFAPFVAGIGEMNYLKFITYNIVGGIAWSAIFLYTGYFFSDNEFIKNNFSIVAIAIVFISVVPIIIEFIKSRILKKNNLVVNED